MPLIEKYFKNEPYFHDVISFSITCINHSAFNLKLKLIQLSGKQFSLIHGGKYANPNGGVKVSIYFLKIF